MKYFYSSDRLAGLLGLLRLRNIRRCMPKKGGTFLSHFDPKYSSAVGNLWKNEKPTRQNLYLWSDPRTATATFGNYLDRDTDLPPRGTREIFSTKTYHNPPPTLPPCSTQARNVSKATYTFRQFFFCGIRSYLGRFRVGRI